MPLLPHRFHTSVEFRSAMPYPRMMKMGLGEALKYGRGPCTHAWTKIGAASSTPFDDSNVLLHGLMICWSSKEPEPSW